MHRFWIFPLILAIAGALCPLLIAAGSIIPLDRAVSFGSPLHLYSLINGTEDLWEALAPYGLECGVILGLVIGPFDWFRNGYHTHSPGAVVSRLILNLWWCFVYVGLIIAFNEVLFCVAFKVLALAHSFRLLDVLIVVFSVAALLNLIAILWASIRTVTRNDVISPRVLRDKLKRSTRIEGAL